MTGVTPDKHDKQSTSLLAQINTFKKAEKALWTSDYFSFARHSMFNWLDYIECEEDKLSEIIDTLTPIYRDMKYFTCHYIAGKNRYIKLTVASQIRQKQDK